MRAPKLFSIIGTVMAFISIFLPWMPRSWGDYYQFSLYDLSNNWMGGDIYHYSLEWCFFVVVAAVIFGFFSYFSRIFSVISIVAIMYSMVLLFHGFFLSMFFILHDIPTFFLEMNVGPIVLIIAGIAFLVTLLVKDKQLSIKLH